MRKLFATMSLALACAAVWAVPTVQQVETEVQQGRYLQAETMMREVVEAKPGSAKAHYLYAEILAHNGVFAKAEEEASKAKQIDPAIKFTQPEKFQAFENLLQRELKPAAQSAKVGSVFPSGPAVARQQQAVSNGIPGWIWIAGLAVIGYLLWRGFSRSRAAASSGGMASAQSAPSANGYGAAPMGSFGTAPVGGAGPGTQYPTPQGAPGGGMLKTGLAVAGGVAAGMMVDEMLHRRPSAGTDHLSGLQNGVDLPPVDDAAKELERRDVDFGTGNGWDADVGSVDPGPASSDDDGWG